MVEELGRSLHLWQPLPRVLSAHLTLATDCCSFFLLFLLARGPVSPFTYLQGMNAICGAFLFCMTEMDAFAAFRSFICEQTPLYWLSSHIGANAGCKLVDQILAVVDPQLAAHLSASMPGAYVYAFHAVSGFSTTIRPLSEVLKLWDFLLAFGPHFNVWTGPTECGCCGCRK